MGAKILLPDTADLSARVQVLERQIRIMELATPLEDDLSAKIDEMHKYLAMGDGFTLNGIARLLMECQQRMAADWLRIGQLQRDAQPCQFCGFADAVFDKGSWICGDCLDDSKWVDSIRGANTRTDPLLTLPVPIRTIVRQLQEVAAGVHSADGLDFRLLADTINRALAIIEKSELRPRD